MLRFIFLAMCVGIFTLFWGTVAILVSFFDSGGNLSHRVTRIWAKWILFVSRIKVTLTGRSLVDPSKSYIYMPNHLSNFDIPVLLAYLPVQFRMLAKAELFKIPFFGYVMKRVGYISIDRSNRRSAYESLKRTTAALRGGVSVLIFPEGTRSRDGNLAPFKAGGFVTAVESGVPIIPVIITGTWEIMSKDGLRIKPGTVSLAIKAPIETQSYTRKTRTALLDKVRENISESLTATKENKC